MLRTEVDINARCEAEAININRGLQQTFNTENPWLNVIITHSKFISSSFISLMSYHTESDASSDAGKIRTLYISMILSHCRVTTRAKSIAANIARIGHVSNLITHI